ncbi:hypothetical protein [Mycobacterium sp. ACS4331]|uniref:hypothetical protein n=1 Tax=Mycobacterium sp. ACS4331 TaxID=1834121 RepID=UPI000802359C|nr:hypothetical protein [Mycobacterium sp. ACS4331]OBF25374.1 hypothetical protein A5727_04365 [Mycobacterium sp. ACS4331]
MVIRGALGALCIVMLAACGTTSTEPAPTSASTEHRNAAVQVTIAGGTVTPVNQRLSATVGEPITFTVDSDAADELHVHAVPERTFDVAVGPDQHFEFTVEVPGRVEVELHHLHRTVAVIDVRP